MRARSDAGVAGCGAVLSGGQNGGVAPPSVVAVSALAGVALLAMVGAAAALGIDAALDVPTAAVLPTVAAMGATLALSVIGLFVAAPVAVGTALWARWLAPVALRRPARFTIELLGDLPPVLWAVAALALPGVDAPEGAVVLTSLGLGAVAAPTIARRALRALDDVPVARMTAARALGLSAADAVATVALPSAARGLVRAVLLGFSRSLADAVLAVALLGTLLPWAGLPLRIATFTAEGASIEPGAALVGALWGALAVAFSFCARWWTR